MKQLLTQKEVCALARISYPTLARWLTAGTFPQPVNGRKKKLLWSEQQITDWMNRQSSPCCPTLPDVSFSQRKRDAKSFGQRQEAAKQALDRHRRQK